MNTNVKLFRETNPINLELQINKFLRSLASDTEILDIKLTSSGNWVTALIYYKLNS